MAKAASQFTDTPGEIARGRGGFYRGANDTPYVSDPAGGDVKSGPRKGQPKRTPYGSPSGFGKLIENTYNLQKWGERRVVLGIGADLALIAECHALTLLDVDSDEYKERADRIVVAAKNAAETNLAADRGSFGHAILEDDDEGRNWIERAEAGLLLGIPVQAQHAMVQAWRDMLVRDGLEVLCSEASCIDDTWRLAGTLDNHARCTRSLRFRLATGEIRVIPSGTILVLDKKTGQLRLDRTGAPLYWHGYVVQVASYAQSHPYNTETEQRGVWPYQVDQTHALIAHIDVLGAIEGNPSCTLVYVDLVAGREHGGATIVSAKAWGARTDLLSVGQLHDEPETGRALDWINTEPANPTVTPVAPDEGVDLSGPSWFPTWDTLATDFVSLTGEPATWISKLIKEAREAGVGFQRGGGLTVRRFEIYRGIIPLAAHAPDDEILRALVALAINLDTPLHAGITAGHDLGALDAAAAARFAVHVGNYIAGQPETIDTVAKFVAAQLAAHPDLAATTAA